ncbi:MAG: tripartite tricarboxylate transporter substrate binding protein [Alphaproteobacteria bacterium]|nr:tripartite tricarboxylate transporter substrate binding protein [Alphaproteobacteria bacterium]
MTINRCAALAAMTAMAIVSTQAHATDWPTKQVTIIVTTAAGGNTDLMARMAAEQLSTKLGTSFVVENRPGAGGAPASSAVASSAPDGYTVLFTPNSAILLAPLVQKFTFDPDKSLIPVTNVGTGSQVIAVNRNLPANNLAEFLAYAKANPKKLNFAAAGTNNISHLAPLLLFKRADVELVMVPSRGEPQAISDLMAGNVNFYFGNASILLSQRNHPAIKLLAVGTAERLPNAPDIPAASETIPGFAFASWNGFLMPAGTPPEIVDKFRNTVIEIVKSPQISQRLSGLGILPGGQTAEQVKTVFDRDRRNFAEAVQAAGIKAP